MYVHMDIYTSIKSVWENNQEKLAVGTPGILHECRAGVSFSFLSFECLGVYQWVQLLNEYVITFLKLVPWPSSLLYTFSSELAPST